MALGEERNKFILFCLFVQSFVSFTLFGPCSPERRLIAMASNSYANLVANLSSPYRMLFGPCSPERRLIAMASNSYANLVANLSSPYRKLKGRRTG